MSEAYLQGVMSLAKLGEQTQRALVQARGRADQLAANTELRASEQRVADCRAEVVAALTRSREALQSMGLKGLPSRPAGTEPTAPAPPTEAHAATEQVIALASEATALSAQQASASEEHHRLAAAAVRADEKERRRVQAERERAERERLAAEAAERQRVERERLAREAARETARQNKLAGLQRDRAAKASKFWYPKKKKDLAALDASIRAVEAERGR